MQHIGKVLKSCRIGGQGTPSHLPTLDSKPSPQPIENVAKSLNVNLSHTFEQFNKVPGGELLVDAFRAVLDGPRSLLLIYGGVGNGKTHLLEASAIELYKRGKFARVMLFAKMLSTLRSAIKNPELSYDEILTNYSYGDRLIMDDVGAGGSDNEFGDRILETIICARYGRELLTIMSTNRDIDTLPERVLSRLQDKSISFLLLNKAKDYRPKIESIKNYPA